MMVNLSLYLSWPSQLPLLTTPGHWPSDMVKEVVVDLEREPGAANGDNLAAAAEAKVHAEAVVSVQSGGGDGAAALDGLLGLARAHGDVKAVAVLIAADPAVPCERGVYAEQR